MTRPPASHSLPSHCPPITHHPSPTSHLPSPHVRPSQSGTGICVPPGVPKSYRSLADYGGVPHSTLHHRAHRRRSMEQKAQSQQYLTPCEEDAVVKFLLQMLDLGQPVRIKFIPQIAFMATFQRPTTARPPKPPGKNWAKGLENRHPELKARRVRALDWN